MGLAVVLGGTGGVGSAVVRAFAAQGDDVLFTYFRARSAARKLAAEVAGVKADALRVDLRDDEQIDALIDRCWAPITALVNATATGSWRTLEDARRWHWQRTFDINVFGAAEVVRRSLDHFGPDGGGVVHFSAAAAHRVVPNYGVIAASKAAIEALTVYAAVEAAPRGIRVNTVTPGLLVTGPVERRPELLAAVREVERLTPIGRLVDPDDVAQVATWLCSPAASMITGQELVIDGGTALTFTNLTSAPNGSED